MRGGWGYNFVSQMGFEICEKEIIYVNLVFLCKAKTKQRSKTHLGPLGNGGQVNTDEGWRGGKGG